MLLLPHLTMFVLELYSVYENYTFITISCAFFFSFLFPKAEHNKMAANCLNTNVNKGATRSNLTCLLPGSALSIA